GRESPEIYPNGISTSLPEDVQAEIVHSIPGLEVARLARPGYGIEHDYVQPTELFSSLETKKIPGLFLAGQINGTTGYEEAAGQGLIAGINAARQARSEEPLILGRDQAYLGVMIDDLVTKGTDEPYRIFTSRAEYRLILREDNAADRLREIGFRFGLVSKADFEIFVEKRKTRDRIVSRLRENRLRPTAEVNQFLADNRIAPLKNPQSLADLLRRPEVSLAHLTRFEPELGGLDPRLKETIEIELKYTGYIERQKLEVAQFTRAESLRIPRALDYSRIAGLSLEVVEKLSRLRPGSLGQASRIPGITPAALTILRIFLEKPGQA
ncbi:MAG: FAD-dependent oxidoreductase, partial [Proteobacteria bacterium]|nr:FAD-dependent oxidoreductase [Pseudomonadota bacterium]